MTNISSPPRLRRKQSADHVGLSMSSLEKRAMRGQQPIYHIDNGKAYYYVSDLDAFKKRRETF